MTLVGFPPVSDGDLMRLGDLNPGWSFERDDEGAITVSPTSWKGGAASSEATRQLWVSVKAGAGGLVLESSTGFRMSTNAIRSPDASWVSQERFAAAAVSHPDDFYPGAPDVAIEIASPSDQWALVCAKIEMYAREGTTYAVALDPRTALVFALGRLPRGITLDLEAIIRAGS